MNLVTWATYVSIFGFCAARLEKRANRNARARNPVANNGQASGANATEDNDNGKARSNDYMITWALKLDYMQPFKHILLPQFSTFCIFILGCQFLLPQRANNEKSEFSQLQN